MVAQHLNIVRPRSCCDVYFPHNLLNKYGCVGSAPQQLHVRLTVHSFSNRTSYAALRFAPQAEMKESSVTHILFA